MTEFELPPELVERLRGVKSIGVITGAGISAESGIPTYRGKGGVYDDPEEGDRTIDALSAPTIRNYPDRAWRAISKIAEAAGGAQPNAAHHALVEIENAVERFVLLTQNVDGLHQLAGTRNIIDIHGSTARIYCMSCGHEDVMPDRRGITKAPTCHQCGGVMRPDVVFFGEMLPTEKVQKMYEEFYYDPPDAVISIGTSSLFAYIMEPVVVAAQNGKLTVEVNPEATQLTPIIDYHLQTNATQAVPAIAKLIRSPRTD